MSHRSELPAAHDWADELLANVPHLDVGVDVSRIESRLSALFESARERWPAWIGMRAYFDHIALVVLAAPQPLAALDDLHPTDLYLAAATAAGVADACGVLDGQIRGIAKRIVSRMRGTHADCGEIASEVIEKLLVGTTTQQPQILTYKARGSIDGWLRAIVSRTYLNRKRKHKREVLVAADRLESLREGTVDPRALHLKSEYQATFAASFEAAIASLSSRDRTLLRYRFVDGATVETIAAIYRVHRATCHRWINAARAALAQATEAELRASLVESMVNLPEIRTLVESQLELSLSRIFSTRQ